MPRASLQQQSARRQSGVTLIELMIVIVVVAILAAIAYPSYQDQVRRSRRAAAQSFMMDVSARQQQRLVDIRSYATSVAALGVTVPPEVDGFYTFAVNVPAAMPPRFTITATPAGAQAQDRCGALSLDQAGAKQPATGCW